MTTHPTIQPITSDIHPAIEGHIDMPAMLPNNLSPTATYTHGTKNPLM